MEPDADRVKARQGAGTLLKVIKGEKLPNLVYTLKDASGQALAQAERLKKSYAIIHGGENFILHDPTSFFSRRHQLYRENGDQSLGAVGHHFHARRSSRRIRAGIPNLSSGAIPGLHLAKGGRQLDHTIDNRSICKHEAVLAIPPTNVLNVRSLLESNRVAYEFRNGLMMRRDGSAALGVAVSSANANARDLAII